MVWVATGSDNNIVRIDARSGGELARAKISQDPSASAYAVAAGADAIWVGSGNDIFKIDSSSHELVGQWDYGAGVNDVAVGGGCFDAGTVTRVDPATGNVVATIRIGGHPSGIAVGANRVWVTVS